MQKTEISTFSQLSEQALAKLLAWQGKTLVVKYGGNAMINEALKQNVMHNLLLLHQFGVKVVLVHGGGPEISQGLIQIGKQSEFLNGLRITDAQTLDIVVQMLAGKVNKNLVSLLKGKGVGLSGADGNMLISQAVQAELGFVGEVVSVNTSLIETVLTSGFIPVIATLGVDAQGTLNNVNGDTAAAAIAANLKADKLLLMTDIAGLLADRNDENSLISSLSIDDVESLIQQGVIAGGMIPKMQCCVAAVTAGVSSVAIIDGRIADALLVDLLSEQGNGTTVHQ